MSYATQPTICYVARDDRAQTVWKHFAAQPQSTRLYDDTLPVHEVAVEECAEEPGCYFAWWDAATERFDFVYPERGLVEMCFPYGTKIEEERGAGKLFAVRVIDLGPAAESS